MTGGSDGADFGRPVVVDADGPLACRFWPGRSSATTVVCVHGVMSTAAAFATVAGGLRLWADVVAPDLPGFGKTPLAGRSGIKALARSVGAVIDRFGHGRAVVVATSMGAAVAARLAVDSPQRVAGIVMDSGYLPAFYGGWRAPAVGVGLVVEQFGKLGRSAADGLMRSALGSQSPEKKAIAEDDFTVEGVPASTALDRMRATARTVSPLAAGSLAPALIRRRYGRIRCPVLVMHGSHDPNVPAPWARAAGARFGWETHVFPAVGHATHLACPERWTKTVGDWLQGNGLVSA